MKKTLFIAVLALIGSSVLGQKVSESTVKKVSLGYDLYSSIWLNMPTGVETRSINQGINVFGMYNHLLNEKGLSVAAGLGISSENLYTTDHYVADIHANVIDFTAIPTGISTARTKMNFTYFDIPLELRLKTEKDFRFGLGFKFGLLMDSKTFYKGKAFDTNGNDLGYVSVEKNKDINLLEEYRFGVQLRAGYKWVQAFGYFSLNKVFIADKGPQMYPVHVGITFMPF
jgi:hypothetical protein